MKQYSILIYIFVGISFLAFAKGVWLIIYEDHISKKTKSLLKVQLELIKEDKYLWYFVVSIIIVFVIFKLIDGSHYLSEGFNNAINSITYSIIAAFIFYLFTDFYPKSKKLLGIYNNIYNCADRILDLMLPLFTLFECDDSNFKYFPEKFVKKFVNKKDVANDKYSINSFCLGAISVNFPVINSLVVRMRDRYGDTLSNRNIALIDAIEDAYSSTKEFLLKEEMSYKGVEAVFLNICSIYQSMRFIRAEMDKFKM